MPEGAPKNEESIAKKHLRIMQEILAGTVNPDELENVKRDALKIRAEIPPDVSPRKQVPKWAIQEAKRRALGDPKD